MGLFACDDDDPGEEGDDDDEGEGEGNLLMPPMLPLWPPMALAESASPSLLSIPAPSADDDDGRSLLALCDMNGVALRGR